MSNLWLKYEGIKEYFLFYKGVFLGLNEGVNAFAYLVVLCSFLARAHSYFPGTREPRTSVCIAQKRTKKV